LTQARQPLPLPERFAVRQVQWPVPHRSSGSANG